MNADTLATKLDNHRRYLAGELSEAWRATFGANEPLRELDLRGVNLSKVLLYGVDLHNTNLSGADLSQVEMSDVNLSGANLSEANLDHAKLTKVNLNGANLQGANLCYAFMFKVDLSNVAVRGADFSRARLARLTPAVDLNALRKHGAKGL